MIRFGSKIDSDSIVKNQINLGILVQMNLGRYSIDGTSFYGSMSQCGKYVIFFMPILSKNFVKSAFWLPQWLNYKYFTILTIDFTKFLKNRKKSLHCACSMENIMSSLMINPLTFIKRRKLVQKKDGRELILHEMISRFYDIFSFKM